ncbi:MAG: serine protease, partial [Phenylobacterium sp.]
MRAQRLLIPALTLLAAAAPLSAARAEPTLPEAGRVVPTTAAGMKQSFAGVVRHAAPAVVNI